MRLSDNRPKLTAFVPLGLAALQWRQQTDTELISDQPSGRLHRGGVITRRRPPAGQSVFNYCMAQDSKWSVDPSLSLPLSLSDGSTHKKQEYAS